MTKETVRETKRGAQIAAIRELADWLDTNPAVPMPTLTLTRHLHDGDGTEVENLAAVRSAAAQLGVGTDESLNDRTVLRYRVADHLWYELFAWHKDGRDQTGELERLRARIAELENGKLTGLDFSREADDPTPVSPARVPLHTGGMTEDGLVDETAGIDPDSSMEAHYDAETEPGLTPSGLTRAADASRGPLAFTTPVVTYFSFGGGQNDPDTGKSLVNHYVTVVAPTYEACREAMFASRFGRAWSFDYLAGTARATEWIPRWREHDVIVAAETNEEQAERALEAARGALPAPVHFDFDDGTSGCGLAATSPHTGAGKWDDVNCSDCFDQVPF